MVVSKGVSRAASYVRNGLSTRPVPHNQSIWIKCIHCIPLDDITAPDLKLTSSEAMHGHGVHGKNDYAPHSENRYKQRLLLWSNWLKTYVIQYKMWVKFPILNQAPTAVNRYYLISCYISADDFTIFEQNSYLHRIKCHNNNQISNDWWNWSEIDIMLSSQHWFRLWFDADRQQGITVDDNLGQNWPRVMSKFRDACMHH